MRLKYATGVHLPQETIGNIILSFTVLAAHPTRGVDMDKRELASCSLTNRFWAQKCRPLIFRNLVIRSLDDFNYLLQLMDSAEVIPQVPSIAECIDYIDVRHSGLWTIPWFHRIGNELSARNVHLEPEDISLEIEGAYLPDPGKEEGKRGYAPRSLSTSLPRTIPSSMFSHSVLLLTDLHFRGIEDLLRLVRDQPALSSVVWKRLTFDKPEDGQLVVPRPRVRRRRPWSGLEAFTISQWSDIEAEIRTVFLIVAEKVNAGLVVISDWWKAMADATLSVLLPSARQIELNLSGDIVRVGFETADDNPLFTHDVEYHIESSPGTIPYVSLFRLCFLHPENATDLEGIKWAAFEDTVLSMHPVPDVEIHVVERARTDIFKWLLDAVCDGKILARLYTRGRLEVGFPATDAPFGLKEYMYTALDEVLALPSEHVIDGGSVSLKESQKFELMLCKDEDKKLRFLRTVLSAGQAG